MSNNNNPEQERASIYLEDGDGSGKDEEEKREVDDGFQDEITANSSTAAPSTSTRNTAGPRRTASAASGQGGGTQQQSSSKSEKEKNPLFKDVEQTGKWGSISKREVYGIGAAVLLVIIAVIVVVVVMTGNSGGSSEPDEPRATAAPSFSPTEGPPSSPEERMEALRESVAALPVLEPTLELLPDDVSFYEGKSSDAAADPVVRAASWVIFDDPASVRVDSGWLEPRFGLAVIYYAMGGDDWTNKDNWLGGDIVCEWHGVECNRFQEHIEEIDLSANNLVNSIPDQINIIQDLRSLLMSRNSISGQIPGLAIGSLPKLTILYLNENELSGVIPTDLTTNGVISTLYLQKNNLAGSFPRPFCPPFADEPLPVPNLGLDCEDGKVFCTCCNNEQYEQSPCF
eukprot:CAMPEP_0194048186 /NCGR_PEP_ID=MMETSP0009_2-20130614/26774_1 /TAXON_ID=210454 /ORGANISM="Grammatophora oceanica, Strain CCMP 410" /LENGTH=398 /DNA_ID=CAMNT_0038694001 /DNA_START=55 /DNA_END=1251 /DNA_ORIENTATION=-